jgi:hypothetical protein
MARIRSSSRREQREIRAVSEQGVRPHAPKSNRAAAKTVASGTGSRTSASHGGHSTAGR